MVCNGCRCYLFLFIVVVIFSIIIAIIYKNENPMVCLLALWVYKCFSLKTSSYTCIKYGFFLIFYAIKDEKPVFFTLDPVAALVYNRTDRK